MTNAGKPVILIYRKLSMWISHQTISSGVRLRETVQSLQNAGRQRCSPLQRGRAWPWELGSEAETAGIVVCPGMEGLCVFERVCSWDRISRLCKTTIYFRCLCWSNTIGTPSPQKPGSRIASKGTWSRTNYTEVSPRHWPAQHGSGFHFSEKPMKAFPFLGEWS